MTVFLTTTMKGIGVIQIYILWKKFPDKEDSDSTLVFFFLKERKNFYIFENNLTNEQYVQILDENLGNLLDDELILSRNELYYQQDGALSHNSIAYRNYLSNKFPQRWIGTYLPINWPLRSSDLTSLDYFL